MENTTRLSAKQSAKKEKGGGIRNPSCLDTSPFSLQKRKPPTEASFMVSVVRVKNNQFFQEEGEMGKEAFVEASDSLFRDLKNNQLRSLRTDFFFLIVNHFVCCH